MKIGIDASRAFASQKTGIEEYSYQVIKHLRHELQNDEVFLYIRKNQKIDFNFPKNWKIKVIKFPYLWTQIGLSLEMLFHPVNVLFIPAHVVPLIHPKNTIVTIHGLEFEVMPEGYSFWARLYMRWSIKMSCRWAKKIIAVSENTRKDLVGLYGVDQEKIEVIYEGVNFSPFGKGGMKGGFEEKIESNKSLSNSPFAKGREQERPYLLFIGRLEKRKNIEGIIEAYKILKEKYKIPHSLVLAGGPGHGYKNLRLKISAKGGSASSGKNSFQISNFKLKIIELGYIDESLKWQLLSNADVFLFPTFYEGFGLPVLEAQSVGVPVVASNNSSIPEIVRTGRDLSVQLVNPHNSSEIAEAAYSLISNPELKNDIIKKGYENIKRFSWKDCSFRVSKILTNGDK
jgi:glycosyltransferase involved in cell wall biosynthesis